MKKFLLSLFVIFSAFSMVKAANGDTTWVQAQNDIQMDHYGNFDTTVNFPDGSKSYQKVHMTFTLGKYHCPGTPQYCGDWDYTVQIFVMTQTGDTFELGRLITPYANASYTRTGWTWTERYEYDVTDFYPLLKNNATIRINYSGYSWGFTANTKFAFVEGTPPRNITGLARIYKGAHNYGDPANPIENYLPTVNKTAPANTQSAELKFNITGHGADNTGCSEFCSKYYQFFQDNNMIAQKDIWRDDCGSNHLYPQSGTWIYERGNWCPGDLIHTNVHKLNNITAGTNFSVNVDMENYTKSGTGTPSYIIESYIVYYGAINKTLDAAVTDIIAPNDHEMYFRENALCGKPIIKVKNNGSTPITSMKLEYGLPGTYLPQYNWTGTLAPLEETMISLPEPWELRVASGSTTTKYFTARILSVNNALDADASNDSMRVSFRPAPKWDPRLIVKLSTNHDLANGFSETSWKIYDVTGNVVAQRTNNAKDMLYNDTLMLGPSCYKLVVEDAGCNGLSFWNNSAGGSGSVTVRKLSSAIPLSMPGYLGGDFGCGFTQYFTTDWPTGVEAITTPNNTVSIEAFPNPAQKNITVNILGLDKIKGTIQIMDAVGKIVYANSTETTTQQLNVSEFANGLYTIIYADSHGKVQTRLLIAK